MWRLPKGWQSPDTLQCIYYFADQIVGLYYDTLTMPNIHYQHEAWTALAMRSATISVS